MSRHTVLFALLLAAAAACRRAPTTSGRQAWAALRAAGLPATAADMVREPGERACPDGGHKRTQLATLRARGDLREVRTTTTYRDCRAGGARLDGMLFTHITHTEGASQGMRIYGNIDGSVRLGGANSPACQVALIVEEGPSGTQVAGALCGLEIAPTPVH